MKAIELRCYGCGLRQEFRIDQQECKRCGWPLEIVHDDAVLVKRRAAFLSVLKRASRMWHFGDFLIPCSKENRVDLGEGGTPLLRLELPGKPFRDLWIKNEGINPTGSFKDRPLSLIVSMARQFGAKLLITASSGNAGIALAAYAAAGRIPAVIVVPESASDTKVAAMRLFGALVVKARGTISEAVQLVEQVFPRLAAKCVNATTTFRNPLGVEADKTIAYELIRDLGYVCPDYVVVPIGAGPLLVGIYKGFYEAFTMGVISRIPRLVGVQADGCAPIARAFREGSSTVAPWLYPVTIASGIADPLRGYEEDGAVTLKFIRDSDGYCISVPDSAIVEAVRLLASAAGVLAEPTGAVGLAGVISLLTNGYLTGTEKVVCIITGQGFKEATLLNRLTLEEPVPVIAEDDVRSLFRICANFIQRVPGRSRRALDVH